MGEMRTAKAFAAVALLFATACSGAQEPVAATAPLAAPGDRAYLRGTCPDRVVIQTNWWPQAEYGALYRLLGDDARPDADRKSVSGALVSGGVDTGVTLEVRSGGPATSFTPAAKTLFVDDSVLLGGADLDQVAQVSGEQPVQSVFAPMDASPVVLMWDPETYPGFGSVRDVGRSDARVLYFPGSVYVDYLTGAGVLKKDQVEGSYDGTPARFVAEGGKVVQQGYITNEVFQYEHEIPQWRKKVGYAFVEDAGYPNYVETMAIRADRKAELSPCLRKLVPMLQQAAVEYVADPAGTNRLITRLVEDYNAYPYSLERAAYAAEAMKRHEVMGNGANAVIGDFDTDRVRRLTEIVRPIFAGQGATVPEDAQLATNEFLDPAIGVE
ncbi:ABC transporter substrate-binding protein [Saccharothrix algeriensis]|uniref:ABC transporter substrate-binding protein n=1 Tax=Saccharothrix algeriensis TaxID=173560 RepID=A0A8T8HWI6_9PSEU|nr:ABC transporter substrate-binding protein [Saccharothrix algeriensis]MBM7814441.1 hypothetical protein [Saccharothrix algeriensis]QTR02741.1 ABC transporter substrate-binding protein [Saccharothrix algeriensis]